MHKLGVVSLAWAGRQAVNYLDRHHLSRGPKPGLVDLADGCGSDRVLFQELENLVERHAQVPLHYLKGKLVLERRQTVLQLLQLIQILRRQQIRSGRQRLSSLDYSRAQSTYDVEQFFGTLPPVLMQTR